MIRLQPVRFKSVMFEQFWTKRLQTTRRQQSATWKQQFSSQLSLPSHSVPAPPIRSSRFWCSINLVVCMYVCMFRYNNSNKQVTWLASSRSEAQVHVCLPVSGTLWWVLVQHSYYAAIIFHRWVWYRMLFLCAMRVIKVQASSSSPRLPLCQISFLSRPPLLN